MFVNRNDLDKCKCVGCGACATVCPKECISLGEDIDGFYKYIYDNESCIDCGLCKNVCPINNASSLEILRVDESYVVRSKNHNNCKESTSGGIAYEIGKRAIEKDYYVIGADWDIKNKRVQHVMVSEIEGLERLRKSKYVNSMTVSTFKKIKENRNIVVFGTPCQIAGVKKCFPKRDDILLVDFDCMGPAGNRLLEKYIDYHNRRNQSGVEYIYLRHKKRDWLNYGVQVTYKDGSMYYKDKFHDPFCQLYNFAHVIQEACIKECPFKEHSDADIRIGDAWEFISLFNYKGVRNGWSLISIQTEKGRKWIEEIKDELQVISVTRKKPEVHHIRTDIKLFESLRDPHQTIEDTVKLYHNKSISWKMINSLEMLLSQNFYIYRMSKEIKKLFDR